MTKNRKKNKPLRFAFFGTSHIAVFVLDALNAAGLLPALIISPSDKPRGRGLAPAATAVSKWAEKNAIPLVHEAGAEFTKGPWDVCIVVDYGLLIPRVTLGIPRKGFLNVHPSLLPRLRGPSPMRSAILTDEKKTGVTIMLVDEEMDHGPIVAQKPVAIPEWPPRLAHLEKTLLNEGGRLLAQILPAWAAGEIVSQEQNHDIATYSEKIKKEDGLLDLNADAYKNLLKIRAYEGWPGTYAFFERAGKKLRVGILDARVEKDKIIIDRVKPEGKKEMAYEEFLRSGARPF